MRPGATRVETFGSIFWLDDEAKEYLRMPKREGPRERGPAGEDWGGPGAGLLEDLKWHPMGEWSIRDGVLLQQLVIEVPCDDGKDRAVVAPVGWV